MSTSDQTNSAPPRPPEGANGFTIIELVITMALLAFVLSAIGLAVRVMSRGFDRGAEAVTQQEMLSRAIATLRNDISRMQRHVLRDDKRQWFAFRGDSASMYYVIEEPGYPTEPGPYAVQLQVRGPAGAVQLVRRRAPIGGSMFEIEQLPYKDEVVLIEGPYAVELSYRESRGGNPGWVKVWADRNRLPELVQIEVNDTRTSMPAIPGVFIRPMLTGEHGCARGAGAPKDGKTGSQAGSDTDGSSKQPPPGDDGQNPDDPRNPPKLSEALASKAKVQQAPPAPPCSDKDGVLAAELKPAKAAPTPGPARAAKDGDGGGN